MSWKENYLHLKVFLLSASLSITLIMLNAPTWLIFVITFFVFSPLFFGSLTYASLIYIIYDIVRPILYIWALVVTVQGEQDVFAVTFYLLASLQAPNIIKRLIGTVGTMFITLTEIKTDTKKKESSNVEKEFKNEQEFLDNYYEGIRQQEKPRCSICKFYDNDRRNECGQARCSKHPFWVNDDDVCDSYKSGVHFDWRMPPNGK